MSVAGLRRSSAWPSTVRRHGVRSRAVHEPARFDLLGDGDRHRAAVVGRAERPAHQASRDGSVDQLGDPSARQAQEFHQSRQDGRRPRVRRTTGARCSGSRGVPRWTWTPRSIRRAPRPSVRARSSSRVTRPAWPRSTAERLEVQQRLLRDRPAIVVRLLDRPHERVDRSPSEGGECQWRPAPVVGATWRDSTNEARIDETVDQPGDTAAAHSEHRLELARAGRPVVSKVERERTPPGCCSRSPGPLPATDWVTTMPGGGTAPRTPRRGLEVAFLSS